MEHSGSTQRRLTDRQKQILSYIRTCVRDMGMPPTHEEIRRNFDLRSAYGVRQHLRLIGNKGYIKLLPDKSRGIKLLAPTVEDAPRGLMEIPIMGRIAAGQPILAEEQIEGRIAVSAELFPRGVLFMLRVKGESMVNVGIRTGDLAVIRQQETVERGQIAAVLRDDEATLKRVYFFDDHLCLKAENDAEPDIRIEKEKGVRVRILGLYVGLIRQAR
jgi:repressor LexA